MSKRIKIFFEARDKRDAKEFIRWTGDNVQGIFEEYDVDISCKQAEGQGHAPPTLVDELLETQLNAAASQELDECAKLAEAAEEYAQSDSYMAKRKAYRKRVREHKEHIRKVIAAIASGGWRLFIEMMKKMISGD